MEGEKVRREEVRREEVRERSEAVERERVGRKRTHKDTAKAREGRSTDSSRLRWYNWAHLG